MNFSLIATILVLFATVDDLECKYVVKRGGYSEEDIQRFFQNITATATSTAQDLVDKLKAHKLTKQAKIYIENISDQFFPLAEKTKAESEKIKEQLKPYIHDSVEIVFKHINDIMTSNRDQMKPWEDIIFSPVDKLEKLTWPARKNITRFLESLFEQARAMVPPKFVKLFGL